MSNNYVIKTASQFNDYIVKTFNVKDDTVTKLEKSRVKQLYISNFPVDSQRIEFMDIMTQLKYVDKVCDEINGYLLWGRPELIVNYLMTTNIDFAKHSANFLSRFQHFCHLCNMGFLNGRGWKQHISSRKHQINQYKLIIMRNDRKELVKDKEGVAMVTSKPLCDINGTIKVNIEMKKSAEIPFYINIVSNAVMSYSMDPLYENHNFEISKRATKDQGFLRQDLSFKAQSQFGHHFYPIIFRFDIQNSQSAYILRLVEIDIIGECYKMIAPISEYKKKEKLSIGTNIPTVPGLTLFKLETSELNFTDIDPIDTCIPEQARANIGKSLKELSKQITLNNYYKQFTYMLYAEELQLDNDIVYYDMQNVSFIDAKQKVFLHLNVPGCIENRPAIIVGDQLYIHVKGEPSKRYQAIVHEVINGTTLKLGLSETFNFISKMTVNVRFTYDKTVFYMMHKMLDKFSKNPRLYENALFPTANQSTSSKAVQKSIKMWFDSKLNVEQKQAVLNILNETSYPSPFIIYGPPGTGKTVTLVEAMKQVWKDSDKNYIIACTPNNLSADFLTERLLKHIDKSCMLRLYYRTRSYLQVPPELTSVSNFNTVTKQIYFPSAKKLKSFRIIVCTMVTYGRVLLNSDFNSKHVTHLFIDEAAQSLEPETLIPILDLIENNPNCKITLAGDPRQLGSIVNSPIAKQYGLECSLLERLLNDNDAYLESKEYMSQVYNEKMCVKLVNNYRSHHAIIEIPKRLFYDGVLNECADDVRNYFVAVKWQELPNPTFPCIFHPVYGKEECEGNSPSYFNIAEVETIESYLAKLLDDKVRDKRVKFVKPSHIGIISPYRGQIQKIKKIIKEKNYGDEIKVGSVEEFQGQERCVIIISSVRSFGLISKNEQKAKIGFMNNPKRFNVAITRAQSLVIIVGNPFMLKLDPNWEIYLKYLKDNKAWYNPIKNSGMKNSNEVQEITALFDKFQIRSDEGDEEISESTLKENLEWPKHD